ncbi:MAG: hypothetical protein OES13_04135 [Acidimicrobiia bacterium]|nr:hypothetical protein [Acidimicrobiia bacterium]
MIRWVYRSLPGPTALRMSLFVLITLIFLVLLHFFYSWVGDTFLDPGGAVE